MKVDVVIIGAGIAGLSLGWLLAKKGKSVAIFEKDPKPSNAAWISGGLLTPWMEWGLEEPEKLALAQKALDAYPNFLEQLSLDCGFPVQMEGRGLLWVACDRGELSHLEWLKENMGLGNDLCHLKNRQELKRLDCQMSSRALGGLYFPREGHVDAKKLLAALTYAFGAHGGTLHTASAVDQLFLEGDFCRGLVLSDGQVCHAEHCVWAAGAWSAKLYPGGLKDLFPLKGQIVTLGPSRNTEMKILLRNSRVYLIPMEGGLLRVGATVEDRGFDLVSSAGAVQHLLFEAQRLLPDVVERPFLSVDVGLRPATTNRMPLVGKGPRNIQGLSIATGFGRMGILMAPSLCGNLGEEIMEALCVSR